MRIPLVRSGGDETPIAWWEWLFTPVVVMLVFVVGGALAIVSIPYFWLYPDRHMHQWNGDPAHTRSLENWRSSYARLTFFGRVRRNWTRWRRRSRSAKSPREGDTQDIPPA